MFRTVSIQYSTSPISTICSGYYFAESPKKDGENCRYLKMRERGQKLYCISRTCRWITDSDNIFFCKIFVCQLRNIIIKTERKKHLDVLS